MGFLLLLLKHFWSLWMFSYRPTLFTQDLRLIGPLLIRGNCFLLLLGGLYERIGLVWGVSTGSRCLWAVTDEYSKATFNVVYLQYVRHTTFHSTSYQCRHILVLNVIVVLLPPMYLYRTLLVWYFWGIGRQGGTLTQYSCGCIRLSGQNIRNLHVVQVNLIQFKNYNGLHRWLVDLILCSLTEIKIALIVNVNNTCIN